MLLIQQNSHTLPVFPDLLNWDGVRFVNSHHRHCQQPMIFTLKYVML